ncbi:MAG: metal-dependent transcriptional regulator [Lachnospiraceae bacterium]|nr:metal-dependent transcriptional regulator [Lachnospiraceae bacterium]
MALRKNESIEDYLECILILGDKKPVVRGVDVANEMGFKKSSVSVAMKNLREKEYITVSEEGYITLTDAGRQIAEMIYERHRLLTEWFVKIGIDPKIAADDACRVEHDISQESFNAIKKYIMSQPAD